MGKESSIRLFDRKDLKFDVEETIKVNHPDSKKELVLIGLLLSESRRKEPSILRWLKSIDTDVLEKYVIEHERSYVKAMELEDGSSDEENRSEDEVVWGQDLIACSLYLEKLKTGKMELVIDEDAEEPFEWLFYTKIILRLEHEWREQRAIGEALKATKVSDDIIQKSFTSMADVLDRKKLVLFKDEKDYTSVYVDGFFAKILGSMFDDKSIHEHDRVMKTILTGFAEQDNEKE